MFTALVLAFAAATAACVQEDPTATLTAIPQTIASETFSGTIPVGGTDTHTFTLGQGGGIIAISLTSTTPENTIVLITIGLTASGSCVPFIGPGTAQAGSSISTQISMPPGGYCVVAAAGSNTDAAVSYSLVVSHP